MDVTERLVDCTREASSVLGMIAREGDLVSALGAIYSRTRPFSCQLQLPSTFSALSVIPECTAEDSTVLTGRAIVRLSYFPILSAHHDRFECREETSFDICFDDLRDMASGDMLGYEEPAQFLRAWRLQTRGHYNYKHAIIVPDINDSCRTCRIVAERLLSMRAPITAYAMTLKKVADVWTLTVGVEATPILVLERSDLEGVRAQTLAFDNLALRSLDRFFTDAGYPPLHERLPFDTAYKYGPQLERAPPPYS